MRISHYIYLVLGMTTESVFIMNTAEYSDTTWHN